MKWDRRFVAWRRVGNIRVSRGRKFHSHVTSMINGASLIPRWEALRRRLCLRRLQSENDRCVCVNATKDARPAVAVLTMSLIAEDGNSFQMWRLAASQSNPLTVRVSKTTYFVGRQSVSDVTGEPGCSLTPAQAPVVPPPFCEHQL